MHESLSGASPAHRRGQAPASPSAMMFRRSGNLMRDDNNDLSWLTLIRRHRFLLFMLALLTLLCCIYLYFAITVASDECSGQSGNAKASCLLKKAKIAGVRGRRSLLSIQDSPSLNSQQDPSYFAPFQMEGKVFVPLNDSWDHRGMQKTKNNISSRCHSSGDPMQRVLFLDCKEANWIDELLRWALTLGASPCDVEVLFDKGRHVLLLTFTDSKLSLFRDPFDVMVCDACDIPWHEKGGKQYLEPEELLQSRWCFLSILGTAAGSLSNVVFHKS